MTSAAASRPRLLIIGDDLSGTADCAVAGARLGLNCVVKLGHGAAPAPADRTACVDVLAIDLDSRRAAPEVAARDNVAAWQSLGHPATRLYKKIDSTLRGNVAAEVAALIPLAGMAIVAPAFPAAGRTTRDGRQWLHGVAVEASEVWRNEGIPGRADLVEMLAGQGVRVTRLALDVLRVDASVLAQQLEALRASGVKAVVCDAETDDHLRRLAEATALLSGVFWVGSAGLAPALMRALALKPAGASAAHAARPTSGPVLVVVGSMSSISHAQVEALQAAAGVALMTVELAVDALQAPPPDVTRHIAAALQRGQHVLVALSQARRGPVADGLLYCQRLAALLAPALPHAGGVIATGGETARALLSAAGVGELQVIEEIESGVPLLRATHAGRTIAIVTKAGGFGAPDTIHTAWRRLVAAARPTQATPEKASP